jgi:hypothetical protein
MSVDRIGKSGGGAVAPTGLPGPGSTLPTGPAFTVGEGAPVTPAASVASAALEQLRAGSIDLARYVELKVAEATSHLSLPPAQIEGIRQALRDRLAADPLLVDLVRVAGQAGGRGSSSGV